MAKVSFYVTDPKLKAITIPTHLMSRLLQGHLNATARPLAHQIS